MNTYRKYNLLLVVICIVLLGTAWYLQIFQHIKPCPLCLLQRYTFVLFGVVALIAFIHNAKAFARYIYAALQLIFSILGVVLASRQVWLQHHSSANLSCLPDMDYLFQHMKIGHALKIIFNGSVDCSQVHWTLFGLSMAEWSLLWFSLLTLAGIVMLFRYHRIKSV